MIRAALVWLVLTGPAAAVTCEDVTYEGNSFTTCTVSIGENLRLFHTGADGQVFGSFAAIEAHDPNATLSFAMNAGMYHDDRRPVGLYLESGDEIAPLVTREGPGNFGLLTNGVFCIRTDRFDVFETLQFDTTAPDCTHATQSGPMLVITGALHPRFIDGGTSRNIRNGVGTSADGASATFVISNNRVNFHDFGSFFRDYLGLDQARYFDGNVSRLHAPKIGRSDTGFPMGPIVGVID